MCINVYTYIYIPIHAYTCIYTYIYMCVSMNICMYVYLYIEGPLPQLGGHQAQTPSLLLIKHMRVCIFMYVYIYIYVCVRICVYT